MGMFVKTIFVIIAVVLIAIINPSTAISDCRKNNPERLDCSSLSVSGACGVCDGNDAAIFYILNTGESGNGDMTQPTEYRVYKDKASLPFLSGFLELHGEETLTICIKESGSIRLEADQQIGHPGKSRPNEVLTDCVRSYDEDPNPTPEPSPTPVPDPNPTPEPSPTPVPDPSPTPEPSPTPIPGPTPILPPAPPPSEAEDLHCQIDGSSNASCQGVSTSVSFSGEMSSGSNIQYHWSYDCKGSTVIVAGKDASSLLLNFTEPGKGKDVDCSISLTITSDTKSVSCTTELSISRCFLDCNNEINGTATVDSCGVCNGDDSSCISCTASDLEPALFSIDGNGTQMRHYVRKATQLLSRVPRNKKFAKKVLLHSEGLYSDLWKTTWSIPVRTVLCDENIFCSNNTENELHKASIRSASESLVNNSMKLFKKAKRSKEYPSQDLRRFRKLYIKNRGLLRNNIALLQEIPDVVQTCK